MKKEQNGKKNIKECTEKIFFTKKKAGMRPVTHPRLGYLS